MGKWHQSDDAQRLTAAFSKDIKELGFLTPDCVLLEIDWACRLRRCNQGKLLNDPAAPEVANLLKGLLKMLYTLETVLHTAFATQPILTVASLEAAILKMPAFKQITAFKDANLGDLQKHPELLRRLRLNDPSMPALPVPKSFPSISHEDIITGILDSLPRKFWDWNAEDAWTLEKGLKYIAEQRGLNDSRLLGIFVQQEFLFRTIISVYKQREVGKGKGHGKGSLEMNLEGSLTGCVLTCSFVFTFLCGAQMSSAVLLRVET